MDTPATHPQTTPLPAAAQVRLLLAPVPQGGPLPRPEAGA